MKTLNAVGKLLSLIIVAGLFLLSSCGKDDPGPVSPIVGNWTLDDATVELIVDNGKPLHEFIMSLGFTDAEATVYAQFLQAFFDPDTFFTSIEFKKDGTWHSVDGVGADDGKWELSADEKILTMDKGTPAESKVNVMKLTATELVLEADFKGDDDVPDGITYHLQLVLSK